MTILNISDLSCLRERIDRLHDLVSVNDCLMSHMIVSATGCNRTEAFALLLLLHGERLADGYILVYHDAHSDAPIERRRFVEGISDADTFFCPECEEVISDGELFYEFECCLVDRIEFVSDIAVVGE